MHPLNRILLSLILTFQAGGAFAGLYKCEGPQGGIAYSDKPCAVDEKSRDISGLAKADSSTGPGSQVCRKVQDFGTDVARVMRRGIDSGDVMNHVGGDGAINPVVMYVINYVYSFKANDYSAGRIGGLVYNKCMGGGFPFPDSANGGGRGSGTGFVVDNAGHILTAQHVVAKCSSVEVTDDKGTYPAKVVARQKIWDLALIEAKVPGRVPVSFRGPKPALGEPVIVAGYPLKGLLTDDLQVATGTISALKGIRNDRNVFQLTAPVQPGNSGGPLFDAGGNVIGVVVSKLNAMALAERTGDIAQNINFAVNPHLIKRFLRNNAIGFATGGESHPRSTTEVAAAARRSVVPVICR
jgi:S1-C subfamily serine protease